MTEPVTTADATASLIGFLADRTKRDFDADTDLFAAGGLSSLFAMELVVHIEQEFGVRVAGPELTLANFRTVAAMTAMIDRLRAAVDG